MGARVVPGPAPGRDVVVRPCASCHTRLWVTRGDLQALALRGGGDIICPACARREIDAHEAQGGTIEQIERRP